MYCLEGIDQDGGKVFPRFLPDTLEILPQFRDDLMGGITILTMDGGSLPRTAIPYAFWNNRGRSPMLVWIPINAETAIPEPDPTIASRSVASASTDWAPGLNDQFEPLNSSDTDKYFFYWWLKKGTTEWVQYDFAQPYTVSQVQVYWLHFDHYDYVCRPPAEWKILYQTRNGWMPVRTKDPFGVEEDKYIEVTFDPVTTKAIRLEAKLQKDFSAGILEWKVY
jgi:hypothetical protein